jgi:hypothetical protein
MKCYVASVFFAVVTMLIKSAVVDADGSSDQGPVNHFLSKSVQNESAAKSNNVFQPKSTPGTCKGKDEPCVPLDFDCCGPYLACDTYALKCVMEYSLKNVAAGNITSQPNGTPATCKGKDEPCVPLDFDCCGPYLACDTHTLKCQEENSLKSIAEGDSTFQPTSKQATCKGKDEPCVPSDLSCCGPDLACDTYALKCVMEKSLKNVTAGNITSQPTGTPATCKGKGEPCVPLDFDCCGAYLACDTHTLKCIEQNS